MQGSKVGTRSTFRRIVVLGVLAGWLVLACNAVLGIEEAQLLEEGTGGLGGQGATGGAGGDGAGSTAGSGGVLWDSGTSCPLSCSDDLHAVVDCEGAVILQCEGADGCDSATLACIDPCEAAESAKRSVGCEYYATFMDALNEQSCFAVFVANTWNTPAHITVERGGALPVEDFAYLPQGFGPTLTFQPFDAQAGLDPGKVAVLFLAGPDGVPGEGNPVCPLPSAVPGGTMVANQTGKGQAFRIVTDVPVVAYQINPYGGGSAAVTGSSLLLPTSAWGHNYVALNAYESGPHPTSLNIIAHHDDTNVSILPVENIVGGPGLPPGSALGAYDFTLQAGEYAQFTQQTSLTGSIVGSDKSVGFMAGARCSFVPAGSYACDHLEQMIPPVKALGSEYAGVSHRSRSGEPSVWRMLGAVDGTALTWSADIGGPSTLDQGQMVEFQTTFPFVVRSQDANHPFILMALMSGGDTNNMGGVGDPEVVLSVPPAQYLQRYVFFTDPTYPETNLVVVRTSDENEVFQDVLLDCAGPLTGWQKLGKYEWTRVDLVTGDFEPVGSCATGVHVISSTEPFGLWVWGWGSPQTSLFTEYVSYGYPAGMNAALINEVELPVPK